MQKARKTAPSALDKILAEEAARLNVTRAANLQDLELWDFLTTASPHYQAPTHLDALLPYLAKIEEAPTTICFSAPPRHGKDIWDETPMLTRRGWILAKDVVVGDLVYGSNGKFTEILEIFPQRNQEQFRVSFSDGSSLVAGFGHRWSVRQRYYDKWYTKTTGELLEDLREADGRKKWQIPIVEAVEGIPAELPIDPYLLGLWLGDGTTADGAITTMDPEIRDYFGTRFPLHPVAEGKGKAKTFKSLKFKHTLKEHGLLGNKHVPPSYLTAPIEDRLALLQGLNDTDGTVAKNGSQQSFCSTLPGLRDAVCELVSSLGGTYTVIEKPTYRKLAYNVYFRLPEGMDGFRLARKQSKLAKFSSYNRPRRFIDAIESVGIKPSRCFMVAASDHLFCAGRDYVVTHNSVAVNHFVARQMLRYPGIRVAYGSYSLDLSAGFFSGEIKDILSSNGVQIDRNHNTKEEWHLANGSSLKAVAPGSGFTGRGADLIVIDDPYKSRAAAESGAIREETWNWVRDVCITRRSPQASVIVTHTRWCYEDVIGTLTSKHGAPYINLPAIDADGNALWPEQFSADYFATEVRPLIGEYSWASLYMGQPIPQGGAVFKGTNTYGILPEKFKRFSIGLDMAYTKKTHADYSSAVVLGIDEHNKHYVLEVVRKQCEAPDFAKELRRLRADYNYPPIHWYVGGQEKTIAEFITNSFKIPIKTLPAKEDKFARAQAVAAAWNAGNVLMPSANLPWAQPFLSEVLSFSGMDDPHDDQVDALAAAYIPSAAKRTLRGNLGYNLLGF